MMDHTEAANADWMTLPFVKMIDVPGYDDAVAFDFWAPLRRGDYAFDCETGRCYAEDLAAYIRATRDMPILDRIARAMPTGEARSGVEIGFFAGLAAALLG